METWTLLNKIATAQNPTSRSERRAIRLQAWRALESLLHQRQVFRVGRKCVSLTKLPPVSARRRGCLRQGSTFGQEVMAETQKSANHKPQTWLKENLARPATPTLSPETKSAPSQEEISAAARALATRPRTRKLLVGFVGGQRGYRDQEVMLPGGARAYLWAARRGRAVVTLDKGKLMGGFGDGPPRWCALPAREIKLQRDPAAILLGGLKSGTHEKPSALKQYTARINGSAPPRPGSRPRGRPPGFSILNVKKRA